MLPSSLTHPQRAIEAAAYTPETLGDTSALFCDPHALNLPDLLEGAETIARVLCRAGHAAAALPVFAVWEWAARRVSRSMHHTVRCRVARVHALCTLGLLREACAVTAALMRGQDLPDADADRDALLGDGDACPALAAALHPGAPENRAAVNFLMSRAVPVAVCEAYGGWACAQVALARVRVLTALAAMPYSWDGRDAAAAAWQAADAPAPAKVCCGFWVGVCWPAQCEFLA